MVIIETPRLRIRHFEDTDAQAMFELNSDPEVVRYTGDTAFEDLAGAQKIIRYVQDQYLEFGIARWVVERSDTNEIIGWSGLKYLPEEKTVDLGYRFFRKYWGMGYGFEAAKACFDYGKETLAIRHMIGRAVQENAGSVQILEKLGFEYQRDEVDNALCFGVYEWRLA